MHRKNITTWMFVAWVVLFWNLGDSLHHMPGLGLHDDVAAAGIDVFESEPVPPDNPLLTLPSVVVAPHIGSATTLTRARMADMAVDNAIAALKGQQMGFCANPEIYR